MTSNPDTGSSVPKEQKEKQGKKGSFGRVLSRVKSVLKREKSGSSAKRLSTASATIKPKTASGTQPEPAKMSEPVSDPKLDRAAEARARYESMEGVSKLTKGQLLEERAKRLGNQYGLEIKLPQLTTGSLDDTVLRMDKPIRMRVRRTCHKCSAAFTSAKECPNCQHTRCTKCTRYPPKRTEAEIVASRERRAAIIKANKENAPIIPDYSCEFDKKKTILTRPSKTGGQDLVYKKPRQRVRRTCHECQTLFLSGSSTCDKCAHVRCTDCPRDPPKKDRYPFGYPGDEFGPNSVPHYECKDCRFIFPTGAEHGTKCRKCDLGKSDDSPRVKPRKVEPEPDPEILRQLQERLQNLDVI